MNEVFPTKLDPQERIIRGDLRIESLGHDKRTEYYAHSENSILSSSKRIIGLIHLAS
jgi:hypothetical protein